MLINPKKCIKLGWIKNVKEEWIQPNGIDIPANKIFSFNPFSEFRISKINKIHRSHIELIPKNNFWELRNGKAYEVISNVYVKIPEKVVAWVIVRSTLNRNGLYLGSGLYDSGYKGPVCCTLYNLGGDEAFIEVDVPIGQIVFMESDNE